MRRRKYIWMVVLAFSFFSFFWKTEMEVKPLEKLSDYEFFLGALADMNPAEGVIPYDLNTALFSNYAEKLRFVKLPGGKAAKYSAKDVFDFPRGTVLIKNFYFPHDFRKPEKGRRILETRLLILEGDEWTALPYVWNEEQTEAFYDPSGETLSVRYVDGNGKKISTQYIVPNKNQCKGCHIQGQKMIPIGTAARHLNKEYEYKSGRENQLRHWHRIGILNYLPENTAELPDLVQWDDPSADLEKRARAYLDVNCGNCHNRLGPASTSGLFLDIYETELNHLGIMKSPVAAGRGSGNLQYDIVPGQPQNSILVFRMKTADPAIAMPEIGREQIHKEGVQLIEQWIRKMPTR